jgi:hypothetical protein
MIKTHVVNYKNRNKLKNKNTNNKYILFKFKNILKKYILIWN